jgi:dipeptidyl aminopeptidase/acylaminoacyl peptidase
VPEKEAYRIIGTKEVTSGNRGIFYLYCRQNGLWTDVVTGFSVRDEPKKIIPFCPEFNVGKDYPPTILFHGNVDTDVPYEQSVQMAAALTRQGIENELITIDGGGHGCDGDYKRPEVKSALEHIIGFMREKIR